MTNCSFISNSAPSLALFVYGGSLLLQDCNFTDNFASNSTVGVEITRGTLQLRDCYFSTR